MTLTIEQVRDTRFHLARRNGYDPADVDTFVDRVETTLVQLAEENATLRQQVAALKSGEGAGGDDSEAMAAKDAEIERLKSELEARSRELEEVRSAAATGDNEEVVNGLRAELDEKSRLLAERDDELSRKNQEITSLNESLAGGGDEAEHLRGEIAGRDNELNALREQLGGKDGELGDLRAQLASKDDELNGLRGEVENLRAQATAGAVGVAGVAASANREEIVVRSAAEASPAVTRLLQMATEQAESLVVEAKAEAERLTSDAREAGLVHLTLLMAWPR